jgi:DNA-binding transcriptional MerR regulator
MSDQQDGSCRDPETRLGAADPDFPTQQLLSIQNVAQLFGVSRWALRHYELRGLIRRRHRAGRIWVFGWSDCDRIAFIVKCRKAGLTLREIAPVVQAAADDSGRVSEAGLALCAALVDKLNRRRLAINEALAELSHARALLTTKLADDDAG